MHADPLTHLGARERAERLDAALQEFTLALDDDLGDTEDRLATLIDVVDEELRASDVVADVLTILIAHRRGGRAFAARGRELTDELPVHRVHT